MTERVSTPTSDVSGDEATPVPEAEAPTEVKGLGRRRTVGSVLTSRGLAWIITLLAVAAAVFAGIQWADLYAMDKARGEVADSARTVALRLTTFEGENIEPWYAATLETATGDYAQQLREVFDQATRDQLREIEAVSRGEIDNLFVQDINGDEASAFALVTQTYANTSTADPVEDHLRMDITLQKVEGEWLANEVAVLGPAGVVAPTGPAQPDAGGDQ